MSKLGSARVLGNLIIDNDLYVIGSATIGPVLTSGVITSTVATGTAPMTVASTTLVANLNAQYINGFSSDNLWKSSGGVWNQGANITLGQTANNQEWSFDITRNGFTGGYWHIWDSAHGTLLKVEADTKKVSTNGQLFEGANRVYSAGNTNIGTGATNYKAGNYAPSKAEVEAVLTGAITSHTHAYLADNHAASGVTSQKITNWDNAYGWGNHAGLYTPISHNSLTNNPHSVTAAQVGALALSGDQTYAGIKTHRTNLNYDGIATEARAGGTGNWLLTLTNASLSANRTITFPDATGTVSLEGHTHSGYAAASHQHNATDINAGTLDAGRIPNLSANKITADTFHVDRIPSLSADKITSDTFNAARIPNLDASKITTGTIDAARLPAIAITSRITGTTLSNYLTTYTDTTGQMEGDVLILSTDKRTYIHNGGTAGNADDWSVLEVPTDLVTSVAGKTGVVTLAKADVGLANVDNTADANKSVNYATTAGSANAVTWANVSGKIGSAFGTAPGTFAEGNHTHAYLADNHAASGVTSQKITNWDNAFGWGNHSGLYTPISHNSLTNNPHSVTAAQVGALALSGDQTYAGIKTHRTNLNYDGIATEARAGGTDNWLLTLTNATLSANRTITFPNATGTVSLEGHTHSYEPTIAAGTTSQWWRGDKTWQALPTFANNLTLLTTITNTGAGVSTTTWTNGYTSMSEYDYCLVIFEYYLPSSPGMTATVFNWSGSAIVKPSQLTYTYFNGYYQYGVVELYFRGTTTSAPTANGTAATVSFLTALIRRSSSTNVVTSLPQGSNSFATRMLIYGIR